MKVFFDNVSWGAESTGPASFAKRLAIQFGHMGITVADPDDYDVALVFIEATRQLDISKPYILGLDGIWFRPDQFASGMNSGIQATYDRAQSVIWQSQFDKQMTSKWFGNRDGHVIRNGIEIKPVALRSQALIELRAKYDRIFVSSAQWHPQKRLLDNINAFRALRANQYPKSCLIVMGSNPDVQTADSDIFYTGNIRHDLCAEVYSMADWMIHLAYLDHCPNSVIECISQGCPVVCSSEGGTKELVLPNNGIVVADAEAYHYDLVDYDKPPRVDVNSLKLPVEMLRVDPTSVDIVKCSEAYADVLRSVLR